MKVLITGGTGFIGSHTTIELIEKGYEVVICDNLSNSDAKTLKRIENVTGTHPQFYELDLQDSNGVHKMFGEIRDIVGVIHFAASKAVGESVSDPLKYYKNNIMSLVNVLESMNHFNINNFVFSSSCTVYGQPAELPVTEKSPITKQESPYANTKKIAEEIIFDAVSAEILKKGILLRYFNPIGAHESGKIGELPQGVPNNLVPYITQTAIGKREKLNVFGNDYDTPDGTCIRDFIHVSDLAAAHIVALERLVENKNKEMCEVFNIGTGKGYTVFEAIKAFEKVSGKPLNYEVVGRRQGDIVKIWADVSLSENELGWKASRDLELMMLTAWKWEQYYSNEDQI
jgi:UDP-glucose 4-epimerase